LDTRIKPFCKWMFDNADKSGDFLIQFYKSLVASGLTRAGYYDDKATLNFLITRLGELYKFTSKGSYDIYADTNDYPDIPKAFKDRPLIKPELTPDCRVLLPNIHDIYAFASYPPDIIDKSVKEKIRTVIKYILHPDYQALPEGYGIIRQDKRRYYAMGWSVHLPGYRGFKLNQWHVGFFIQRLELMAHFPISHKHKWFEESLKHIKGFQLTLGQYKLDRTYLKEKPNGYWVTGTYMGLEENRRYPLALNLESTFRILKIKKLANLPLD